MNRKTLDAIEVDILKGKIDVRAYKARHLPEGDTERIRLGGEMETMQRRYKELTGKYYTYRHCDRCPEEPRGE